MIVIAPAIVGGAISAAGSLYGGSRAASAARDQAEKQNEATIRRFEYDTAKYDMDKQQIRSNRNFAVQEESFIATVCIPSEHCLKLSGRKREANHPPCQCQ